MSDRPEGHVMGKDIQQSVELPASPEVLFEMYVDAKQHSALTGSEVAVSREPGSAFSAFGGALSGRMVATVPGRLVVQTWRSTNFAADDPTRSSCSRFRRHSQAGVLTWCIPALRIATTRA